MKPKKLSKAEAKDQITKIFASNPNKEQIKKAKKLAMAKNIKLGSLRKKFCKKCYTLFNSSNSQIRIKNKTKTIKCVNCNYISRYKMK